MSTAAPFDKCGRRLIRPMSGAHHYRRLLTALLLGGVCGCQAMFARPDLPDDPLFHNRKPLEAKARSAPPAPLAYSEPTPPANPYFVDARPGAGVRPTSGDAAPAAK